MFAPVFFQRRSDSICAPTTVHVLPLLLDGMHAPHTVCQVQFLAFTVIPFHLINAHVLLLQALEGGLEHGAGLLLLQQQKFMNVHFWFFCNMRKSKIFNSI